MDLQTCVTVPTFLSLTQEVLLEPLALPSWPQSLGTGPVVCAYIWCHILQVGKAALGPFSMVV